MRGEAMIDYSIGNGIDLGRGYRIGQSFGYSNNRSVFRDEEIEHQLSRSGESVEVPLPKPCDHAIGFSNGTIVKQSHTERSNFHYLERRFAYCPKCGVKL